MTDPTIAGATWRSWFAVAATAFAVLLGVITAYMTQMSFVRIDALGEQRVQAAERRIHLMGFLSLFKDIESGQRGFVITGRDSFLEPYTAAVAVLPQAFAFVQTDNRGKGAQDIDWPALEAAVADRQAVALLAISARRAVGTAVLNDTDLFDRGKKAMDQIRASVARLDGMHMERIASLKNQMDDMRRKAFIQEWTSSIGAGLLVAFATVIWLKERRLSRRLMAELAQSNASLERRVIERTEKLSQAGDRIRGFAAEMDRAIEAERWRLSGEVLGQIGRVFASIKTILQSTKNGPLAPAQQGALASAIQAGVTATERIAAELRPPLLDDRGLAAAIDHYLRGTLGATGCRHSIDLAHAEQLSKAQSLQLFRMVQEACTGVIRHSAAQHIAIAGGISEDRFKLVIEDDGVGVDQSKQRVVAIAMISIRERAALLDGDAAIGPRAKGGIRFDIQIPLQPKAPL